MSQPHKELTPAYNFSVHSSALLFLNTQKDYLRDHAKGDYSGIGTGALVFDHSLSETPQILLIQRAATDSMPNQWEVPGGASDDEDKSILHAVARELWEEAGLRATSISGPVGEPQFFTTRSGKGIAKFNFVVQVETASESKEPPNVTLDPNEHQSFVWATEDQIRRKQVGDVAIDFTSMKLEDIILRQFEAMRGFSEAEVCGGG